MLDLTRLIQSQKGCELPWRVTVVSSTAKLRDLAKKPGLAGQSRQRGTRKSKKRRIAMRKSLQLEGKRREDLQRREAEKEAAEKEKRTKRNREKKVKRKLKDKARKRDQSQAPSDT